MSVTLACWKWIAGNEAVNPNDVYSAILNDQPHAALGQFDIDKFERALRKTIHVENEFPFEIDRGNFKGHSCNWVLLHAGDTGIARFLKVTLQVASSMGLVVFQDDRERLVDLDDANRAAQRWAGREQLAEGTRNRHEQLVSKYLAPTAIRLGFRMSGETFRKKAGDLACTIRPNSQDFASTWFDVNFYICFLSLLKFQNEYRAFCQEKSIATDGGAHVEMSLPPKSTIPLGMPQIPRTAWSLNDNRPISELGEEIAAAVEKEAMDFFGRYQTLNDLTRKWEEIPIQKARELSCIYWLLGDKDRAFRIIEEWDAALDENLRTRLHPPSRSAKVEIRFFRNFLNQKATETG